MVGGYSHALYTEIEKADGELLGVALGKVCIKLNIPVTDVAKYLHVSRPAVYAWFRGTSYVSYKHEKAVRKLLKKLS